MAEKVRYYLEQSVPELEDLKRKGLFDKNEITMIMRRRTDFEHRILGRGTKARDFLRYADFEDNLEKLRKKKYKRLNKAGLIDTKPSISDWAGIRRILFIYDRATRRFPGDLSIWGSYLRFAKKNGAIKVIYKVYSRLLQLQPRNIDAWLSAAKYEFEENSNAKGSRLLLQRALRFNPESLKLWLSYAQFELSYVSKLLARRKVLGLLTERQQQDQLEFENKSLNKKIQNSASLVSVEDADTQDDNENANENDDEIKLPTVTNEDMNDQLKHLPETDMNMLGNPENNPALRGDIALTIFDLAVPTLIKQIPENSTITNKKNKTFEISNEFMKVFDSFSELNRNNLCAHVINSLSNKYPKEIESMVLDITLPIRNINIENEHFADSLKTSVNKFIAYKSKLISSAEKQNLTNLFTKKLNDYLQDEIKPSERVSALLRTIIKKCQT